MTIVEPWIDIVTTRRLYAFQENGAPAYISYLVQTNYCTTYTCFGVRHSDLPNSPDFNPVDDYVWSVIERIVNKPKHFNAASLQVAIEATFFEYG